MSSIFPEDDLKQAAAVVERCKTIGWMVATAESCTGGLVSALLTDIAGSSVVVDRGFVTYSNEAKMDLLGVPAEILARQGAVSRETALAMASGALARSRATCAVAITGIAGPGGGSAAKPVGCVWFGLAVTGEPAFAVERRFGDIGRSEVRLASLKQALDLFAQALDTAERTAQATP